MSTFEYMSDLQPPINVYAAPKDVCKQISWTLVLTPDTTKRRLSYSLLYSQHARHLENTKCMDRFCSILPIPLTISLQVT